MSVVRASRDWNVMDSQRLVMGTSVIRHARRNMYSPNVRMQLVYGKSPDVVRKWQKR